jgi:superfamily I DNA/RNA helicase
MCLNVPQYSALDDDQKKVYLLPFDGRNIVSGPPGTGKSVIAIHRAAAMAKRGKLPTVLMYNRLLQLWTSKALEQAGEMAELHKKTLTKLESKTTETWFLQWFKKTFGVAAPRREVLLQPGWRGTTQRAGECEVCKRPTQPGRDLRVSYRDKPATFYSVHPDCLPNLNEQKAGNEYRPIDYGKCLEVATQRQAEVKSSDDELHVLIDEGQDLPNNAYVLLNGFCESITVYLDSAQTITDNRSTEQEIASLLEVDDSRTQVLRKNYRNGKEVHRLAQYFRPDHMSVGDEPQRKCSDVPRLIGFSSADKETSWISTLARNYANLSIGVFVYTKEKRDSIAVQLTNSGTDFQIYTPGPRGQDFDPCKKGIILATQANAKGLEFDIVVIAGMETWPQDIPDYLYGQFYVLITRSRDRLFLSYIGNTKDDLPKMMTSSRFESLINKRLIAREFRK